MHRRDPSSGLGGTLAPRGPICFTQCSPEPGPGKVLGKNVRREERTEGREGEGGGEEGKEAEQKE